MCYYVRTVPGSPLQLWKIDVEEGTASLLRVTNPTLFKADPGETIWDALKRNTPWFDQDGQNPFHKTALRAGEFFPRMARPVEQEPTDRLGWNPNEQVEADVIAVARGQLTALMRQLDRICQTIHPIDQNLDVFGHDIRNLLILACTEVENHWRGVMESNGVTKRHLNTRAYVELQAAMKLDRYDVSFPYYPWLPAFKPFAGWGSTENTTRDIKWYDAYNAVKHRRETTFERATLRCAFDAISACLIMIVAQYGRVQGFGNESELWSFFHLSSIPDWTLSDIYIYPNSGGWSPAKFPFNFRNN